MEKLELRPYGKKSAIRGILDLARRSGDDPPDVLSLSQRDGQYLSRLYDRYLEQLRRKGKLEGPTRFH